MTPDDDAYVTEWFVQLEDLAASSGHDVDRLRELMLADRLPLPSYIRSDGAQMVARDLLELSGEAGGFDEVPEHFANQFETPADAVGNWDGYLRGHFVCLRSVTPANMKRKGELVDAIGAELDRPDPDSTAWLDRLHGLVDELDELEPPFAPYDRLRFAGPVSRDRLITDVRSRFPRSEQRSAEVAAHSKAG